MAVKKKTKSDPAELIIDAALKWTAEKGWRSLTMSYLAEETGLSLPEIHVIYPCKATILNALVRSTDEQVLAAGAAEGDSIRDRLFDLLMRRFDVLNQNRAPITAIARDTWCDPATAFITGPRMLSSMYWMLDAAGVRANGLSGALRCKALLLIYANAFRVWLSDETEDMAATMAALDQGLARAEHLQSCCRGR